MTPTETIVKAFNDTTPISKGTKVTVSIGTIIALCMAAVTLVRAHDNVVKRLEGIEAHAGNEVHAHAKEDHITVVEVKKDIEAIRNDVQDVEKTVSDWRTEQRAVNTELKGLMLEVLKKGDSR